MNAALIANECIDSYMKSVNSSILCKLYTDNAYTHVFWNFLLAILEKMDFSSEGRNLISFCISIVRFSILINSEAYGFFSSSRGLRQGEPVIEANLDAIPLN